MRVQPRKNPDLHQFTVRSRDAVYCSVSRVSPISAPIRDKDQRQCQLNSPVVEVEVETALQICPLPGPLVLPGRRCSRNEYLARGRGLSPPVLNFPNFRIDPNSRHVFLRIEITELQIEWHTRPSDRTVESDIL